MERKLIIFTGHSKLDSGGVGTHLRLLMEGMSSNGALAGSVMGCGKVGKLIHLANKMVAKILSIPSYYESIHPLANILFLEKQIDNELKKNKDSKFIIHCHDRSCVIAAQRLKPKYDIKIIQTIHAPFYQQYEIHPNISKTLVPHYMKGLDYASSGFADHYIAVDELQRELILRDFGEVVSADKVTVIHNAVEESLLSLANQEKDDYFIVARHLHEKNGVEFAIRAFAQYKSDVKKQDSLLILGSGPLEAQLKDLAGELGISEDVKFMGAQPRAVALNLIAKAKASLVPSVPVGDYIEATSLTMLESMALGVPLIASNIGGIKEVLDGKGAAYLTEPSDIEEISKAMEEVDLKNEACAMQVGLAKEIIRNGYTVRVWIERIVSAYGCSD